MSQDPAKPATPDHLATPDEAREPGMAALPGDAQSSGWLEKLLGAVESVLWFLVLAPAAIVASFVLAGEDEAEIRKLRTPADRKSR